VKLRTRLSHDAAAVVGTARTDRRTSALLPRLARGDLAVLDHVDLDGPTAEALVDAGVVAVLNRAPMISGRFPNRGPQVLVDAGVLLVDQVSAVDPGRDVLTAIPDGRRVSLVQGQVMVGEQTVASGRVLTPDDVADQLAAAQAGLSTQLGTLTHTSVEFLRREEPLLLHGEGVPALRTKLRGRPVVVVAHGPDALQELRRIKRYLREMSPVVIVTADAVETARTMGLSPDVIVVDSGTDDLPPTRVLRAAHDVVVTEPPGTTRSVVGAEKFERIGLRPRALKTTAAPADAALLLADAHEARPVIGVGVRGTIEEFLDGSRGGLGSGYVTRLKVGPRLVDASAVPMLYSGRVRAIHAYLVLLVGLIAVCAAIATTDVGQQWAHDLHVHLQTLLAHVGGGAA
jgi:uncharacterized membrane-anchored protein